jgi:hypothetical protein
MEAALATGATGAAHCCPAESLKRSTLKTFERVEVAAEGMVRT